MLSMQLLYHLIVFLTLLFGQFAINWGTGWWPRVARCWLTLLTIATLLASLSDAGFIIHRP